MPNRTELFLKEFEKLIGAKLEVFADPFKPNTLMIPDTTFSGYIETHTGSLIFMDESTGIKKDLNNYSPIEFYHFCKVLYVW